MKQVVATTERDDIVAEGRVAEAGLIEFLAPWLVRPEYLIYVEGELIIENQNSKGWYAVASPTVKS